MVSKNEIFDQKQTGIEFIKLFTNIGSSLASKTSEPRNKIEKLPSKKLYKCAK